MKRVRDILSGVVIGCVLAAVFAVSLPADGASEWSKLLPFSQSNLLTMRKARSILETYFVDGDKGLNEDKLFFGSMKGLVAAIDDPYTRFVAPEQLNEENMEMEGEYGGLGMYVGQRDGKILVISPIEDTPAEKAGVKPLDEIVKVNDTVILGMDQDKVVKMLRGPAGSSVTVWVRRSGDKELRSFKMKREVINIKTVRFEMMNKIAYIKLNNFHQKTAGELRDAISGAKSKKAAGIILDVRNNPGGLLDSAVDVAEQFLDGGLVVSMKGRTDRFEEVLNANKGNAVTLPLVVLVNEGSASASEIVAGAIQDRKRGVLVGMKTYGKGSVQSLFNLPDDSGMYVTVARYMTPSGKIIDHKGLLPDYKVAGTPMLDKTKDVQLKKAIGVMNNILLAPKKK
ncbi:carboxyl-terminal processing protease [Synergistales bacterium]|nr:carboxyl-terminal processing protease [Synergistales bacterium]